MATIGSLVVDLKAQTAAFRRDLGRARRDVRRFATRTNRQLATINSGFAALGRSAKGFIGVFAATAGVRGIDQMFQSLSDLADTADKLGVTAEQLQQLRFAADQTGIASNTLDMAIQRFTRRLGEAAQGGGELKGTLDQYRIAVTDSTGRTRDSVDVLGDLAEAIRTADSDAERLRIGFKAFDSEGAALVNTLREGRQGLEELSARAATVSEDLVNRGREINDAWRELTQTIGVGIKSAILTAVTSFEDLFAAAIPGVFRIETTVGALEDQLAGLRDRAREVRAEMTAFPEAERAFPAGRMQFASLQRRLSEIDEMSFQVQQRLEALRRGAPGGGGAPVDTTAEDRIRSVTDELRFQAEQLERTAEVQRIYNETRRAGVEADSAAGMEIRNLVERLQEAEREQGLVAAAAQESADRWQAFRDAAAQAARAIDDGMGTIRRSSERALGEMTRDLLSGENAMDSLANAARRTVDAIVSEFLRLAVIRPIIGSIFGVATTTAGTVATSPAGGAPTGGLFQHGGQFTAEGPGGTDAIAARLQLTKGERVTVETPAQQRMGRRGESVTINQSFDFRGADAGVFARAQQFKDDIKRETIAAVHQLLNDGGQLAIAAGRRR